MLSSKIIASILNRSSPRIGLNRNILQRNISVTQIHEQSKNDDYVCPATISGMDFIRNPRLFRGMGFTLEERQALGIHGLLPPRVKSLEEQTDN